MHRRVEDLSDLARDSDPRLCAILRAGPPASAWAAALAEMLFFALSPTICRLFCLSTGEWSLPYCRETKRMVETVKPVYGSSPAVLSWPLLAAVGQARLAKVQRIVWWDLLRFEPNTAKLADEHGC